jgi:hypothetical protein
MRGAQSDRLVKLGQKHRPTPTIRRQVTEMAATGIKQSDIAHCLGMHPITLKKYYDAEFWAGRARAKQEVLAVQKRIATNEDHKAVVQAAGLWLKAAGELNDGPQIVNQQLNIEAKVIDAGALGADQRQALKQLLLEARSKAAPAAEPEPIDAEYTEVPK